MMRIGQARWLAVAGIAALVSGCSGSGPHYSAGVLQKRLQAQLSPELATHQVAVQRTRDGAVVSFDQNALFVPGQSDLTPDGQFTMASVVESLLDPRLMRLTVGGAEAAPDDLQAQRAQTILHYIGDFSLFPPLTIQAGNPTPSGAAPQALAIAIQVQCPPGPQGSTWTSRERDPTCD